MYQVAELILPSWLRAREPGPEEYQQLESANSKIHTLQRRQLQDWEAPRLWKNKNNDKRELHLLHGLPKGHVDLLIFTIEKKIFPPLEGVLMLSYYSGFRPFILNFKKTQVSITFKKRDIAVPIQCLPPKDDRGIAFLKKYLSVILWRKLLKMET